MAKIATGAKENIQSALDSGKITPLTLVVTSDTNESAFIDV